MEQEDDISPYENSLLFKLSQAAANSFLHIVICHLFNDQRKSKSLSLKEGQSNLIFPFLLSSNTSILTSSSIIHPTEVHVSAFF